MQIYFKIRDSKQFHVCGKHLGHVPRARYTPTSTPSVGGTLVETQPRALSGEQFIRDKYQY